MWHFDGDLVALETSTEVWDDGTGETVASALERFRSLSPGQELMTAADVIATPDLDREFWSFGYGDDPAEFTTITPRELLDNIAEGDKPADLDYTWGPFMVLLS